MLQSFFSPVLMAAAPAGDGSEGNFMIAVFLVLMAAWLGGVTATRLGYPAMLGELLIGLLLGPPLLGLLQPHSGLAYLGEIGIFIMMLYIGAEIDPKEMIGASKAALLAAVGGIIVPLTVGFGYTYWYLNQTLVDPYPNEALIGAAFVGMAVSVTSLAANSRILLDLKLLDSRIAIVLMVGALLADTGALIMFAGIMGFAEAGELSAVTVGVIVGKALLFFVLTIVLGWMFFPKLMPLLNKLKITGPPALFMIVMIIALCFGELAHLLGLHGILGAFMAGIALKKAVPDRRMFHEITDRMHVLVIGLLAPIFFVIAGFEFSFDVLKTDLLFIVIVFLIAVFAKIIGTVLFYLPSGNGWREGLVIGLGMNGRGAVEIIVAQIGLHAGLINETVYSALVFMAIFTTAMVPSSLKWGVKWLQKSGELVRVRKREGFIIIGGGPLARRVAAIAGQFGPVALVDRNRENCKLAAADGTKAVAGNALDEGVLEEAGALQAQTVISLTPNAEINLLAARYAVDHFQVPRTVVLLDPDRSREMAAMLEAGNHQIFWQQAFAHQEWDRRLAGGQVMTSTVDLETEADVAAFSREASTPHVLPILMRRDKAAMVIDDASTFEVGDHVVYLHTEPEEGAVDSVTTLLRTCPILDLEREMNLDAFLVLAAEQLAPRLQMSTDAFVQAYRESEGQSGTILGQGVAIPHIELDEPGKLELLVARATEGVAFPPDDEAMDKIFVLAVSRERRNEYLRSLAAIAHIVQSKRFQRQWQNVKTVEELRSALLAVERLDS